ncbi:MAG: DUF928 domain-containing protein [Cyanobacteria bacterium]|nr:DUF928 domain-containing protein [Cyanobacteriota bacterium]
MPSKFTTLVTSILALVSLQTFIATSPNQSAFAKNTIKYQPPGRVSPGRTESSGTRSIGDTRCPGSQKSLFLATLSPANHIGQTSLARPTLYAYFTGNETLEIRLRQVGKLGVVWKQTIQPKTPGFQAISYPKNAPELITGENYSWSASIICNPAESYKIAGITYASLTRIEEPPTLQDLLKNSKTVNDRAQSYANSSLWYEALDTLAAEKLNNSEDIAIQTELINLLEQVGLNKTAKQERDHAIKKVQPKI